MFRLEAIVFPVFGIFVLTASVGAAPVYVDPTNTSDPSENGTALHPFDTIQEAVDDASSGNDVIILLPGTYTGLGNKGVFITKDLVFSSVDAALVVINCEGTDRAFHVSGSGEAEFTEVTIRNGFAPEGGAAVATAGGIMRLNRCVIEDCASNFNAGAVRVTDARGYFTECTFTDNFAGVSGTGVGGAIQYIDSFGSVTDCAFIGNSAETRGGAILIDGWSPSISGSSFTLNAVRAPQVALDGGGAVYNDGGLPSILGCTFDQNSVSGDASSSGRGGAIYSLNGISGVSDSTFTNNSVGAGMGTAGGGAVASTGGVLNLTNCEFEDNSTGGHGGAVLNEGSPIWSGCTFRLNTAARDGGAVWSGAGIPIIEDCSFESNDALGDGGGLAILTEGSGGPWVRATYFTGNSAVDSGGGVSIDGAGAEPTFLNCVFSGNKATSLFGGGLSNQSNVVAKLVKLTNCTFAGNHAGSGGGGVYSAPGTDTSLINSIAWGDTPDELSAPILANLAADYCTVQGGWTGPNSNIVTIDPIFVDADGADSVTGTLDDDLRLSPASFAADSGNTLLLPANKTQDIAGNSRVQDDWASFDTGVADGTGYVVDMGAYETVPALAGDVNLNGIVDVNDISYVLFRLGNSGFPGTVDGDANYNGGVDVNDISYVLCRLGT